MELVTGLVECAYGFIVWIYTEENTAFWAYGFAQISCILKGVVKRSL
jgi:hypothetical protein